MVFTNLQLKKNRSTTKEENTAYTSQNNGESNKVTRDFNTWIRKSDNVFVNDNIFSTYWTIFMVAKKSHREF